MPLGVFSPSQSFGRVNKDWFKFFVCLVEFTSEVTWPWISVCWEVLLLLLLIVSLVVIDLVKLFLLDSVLMSCIFLDTHPFLLVCPICWYINVHSTLMIFCISAVSVLSLLFYFLLYVGSLLGEPS